MIIFVHEERAYRYWIAHHRHGFVLDGRRKPKLAQLTLHRATCSDLKAAPSKTTHWTTGGRLKACSLDTAELQVWLTEECGQEFSPCPKCLPLDESTVNSPDEAHLTRLERDALDYVLESAAIHFEWPDASPYHLTVGDVALCLRKTPAQISPVLHQLMHAGLITIVGKFSSNSAIPKGRLVLPTAPALKSLTAFTDSSDEELQTQLSQLCDD